MGLAVQRVDLPGGEISWTVLDEDYAVIGPVDRFLAPLQGADAPDAAMLQIAHQNAR